MEPTALIKTFARNLGFADPQLDSQEGCLLEFEDGAALRCQVVARQEILVSAVVCSAGSGSGDQDVKRLLQLNLGRANRQREVLAADAQTGEIVLFRKLRTSEMEYNAYEEAMERFLNSLDFWTTNAGGGTSAASASPFSMVRP